MKKYKVEFKEINSFIVDVLADSIKEAEEKARKKWEEICLSGIPHYYQQGDTETETGKIFDVTETDDPFNP